MIRAITVVVVCLLPVGFGLGYEYLQDPEVWGPRKLSSLAMQSPLVRTLLLAIMMYLGIGASLLSTELMRSGKGNVSARKLAKTLWKRRSFLLAVVISPVVFYSVYLQAKAQPDDVIALLVAFQNGFFWQSVLKGAGTERAG